MLHMHSVSCAESRRRAYLPFFHPRRQLEERRTPHDGEEEVREDLQQVVQVQLGEFRREQRLEELLDDHADHREPLEQQRARLADQLVAEQRERLAAREPHALNDRRLDGALRAAQRQLLQLSVVVLEEGDLRETQPAALRSA